MIEHFCRFYSLFDTIYLLFDIWVWAMYLKAKHIREGRSQNQKHLALLVSWMDWAGCAVVCLTPVLLDTIVRIKYVLWWKSICAPNLYGTIFVHKVCENGFLFCSLVHEIYTFHTNLVQKSIFTTFRFEWQQ